MARGSLISVPPHGLHRLRNPSSSWTDQPPDSHHPARPPPGISLRPMPGIDSEIRRSRPRSGMLSRPISRLLHATRWPSRSCIVTSGGASWVA